MTNNSKTWEQHVEDAKELVCTTTKENLSVARLTRIELAQQVELAHGRTILEATELVGQATRLLRKLESEGMGARCSGNNYLAQAQTTRESLLALESARHVYSIALRIERNGVTSD